MGNNKTKEQALKLLGKTHRSIFSGSTDTSPPPCFCSRYALSPPLQNGLLQGGCGLDVVVFFLPLHSSQIFPLLLCRSSMAAVLLGIPTLCLEHFLLSFFSCAQPAGLFLSPFFLIPHCLCGVFCPFLHTSPQGRTSLAGGLSCTLW